MKSRPKRPGRHNQHQLASSINVVDRKDRLMQFSFKKVALAFAAMHALLFAAADATPAQSEVTEATSDAKVDVLYKFVNAVSVSVSNVNNVLDISGAAVFDSVAAGDLKHAFANSSGSLEAEITAVSGNTSPGVTDLEAFYGDDNNYLEFGIIGSRIGTNAGDRIDTREEFNQNVDQAASLIEIDSGNGVQPTSPVVLDDDTSSILFSSIGGGAGSATNPIAYYIRQVGDGPGQISDGDVNITVTFTVSNPDPG